MPRGLCSNLNVTVTFCSEVPPRTFEELRQACLTVRASVVLLPVQLYRVRKHL